jgi:hypothetical protein
VLLRTLQGEAEVGKPAVRPGQGARIRHDHQLARILCRYRLQTAEGGRRTGAKQVKSVPSTNIYAEFSRNEVSMGLHARRMKPGKAKQGRTGSPVGRSVCGGPDRWGELRSGRIERSANPLISGSRRRYGGEQHDEKPARTRLPPGAAPPFGRAAGKPRGAWQAGHLNRCKRRIHDNDACIDLQSMQESLAIIFAYLFGRRCLRMAHGFTCIIGRLGTFGERNGL